MAARLTALIVVAIVTITVIAGLIVGAQRDDGDGPVDLIVYNARVFAADGTAPFDGAVAVRGQRDPARRRHRARSGACGVRRPSRSTRAAARSCRASTTRTCTS